MTDTDLMTIREMCDAYDVTPRTLRFYEAKDLKDCLDVSLDRVTQTLKLVERKLSERRRALARAVPDVEEPRPGARH